MKESLKVQGVSTCFVYVLLCITIVLCIAIPTPTFSATEDVTIASLVGSDATPPTTPASLTATGVATTQINLAWSSSTDNYLLSGYHVYRDDVHIATTTLPSYSDTGLTASTSYLYYVVAFDSAFNFSGSSTVATGTTLSPSVATTSTTTVESGSIFGSRLRPIEKEILSLEIVAGIDSVRLKYETEHFIRSTVRWGETTSYEMGSLLGSTFLKIHEITIPDLQPGKRYYFVIEGENGRERTGVMYTGTFTTLPAEDIFAPSNVSNLEARQDGEHVVLTWENPKDLDFANVRIMRSGLFYPSDTADGRVLYEGSEERFIDMKAFQDGERQYYTIFTYDEKGNVSSGAVAFVVKRKDGEVVVETEPIPIDEEKNEIKLNLEDILFSQEGIALRIDNGRIAIDGSRQLTISIPYDTLPEHLKTILVVLGDARDPQKTFSFILRVNASKTYYTGTLAPFGNAGEYPLRVAVFDFDTRQIGYVHAVLVAKVESFHATLQGEEMAIGFIRFLTNSYILWFGLLIVLLTLVSRRLMHARF